MQNAASVKELVMRTVRCAHAYGVPLLLEELHERLVGESLSLAATSLALDDLVSDGQLIRRADDMICLANHREVLTKFDECQPATKAAWRKAERWARRVGRIPLVRLVAVTGPLARGSVTTIDHIDLLVATRPRRLWLARRLVLALLGFSRGHGIPVRLSSVVSTRSLEFPERSLHLAHELSLATVIVGSKIGDGLRRSNSWTLKYLPNAHTSNDSHLSAQTPSSLQRWVEWFLLLPPFRLAEQWCQAKDLPSSSPLNSADLWVGPLFRPNAAIDAIERQSFNSQAHQSQAPRSQAPQSQAPRSQAPQSQAHPSPASCAETPGASPLTP